MGYGLTGVFLNPQTKKKICEINLDFMKCLNERSYSSEFSDIESLFLDNSEEYDNELLYNHNVYYKHYKKEIVNEKFFTGKQVNSYSLPSYEVPIEDFDANKEEYEKFEVTDANDVSNGNAIIVCPYSVKVRTGSWYDIKCIEDGKQKILNDYQKALEKYSKLKSFEHTKDWFEMSEDAKESWHDELRWAKESLDFETEHKEAVEKIANIFDFLNNNLGIVTEQGTDWNHFSSRDCLLFVYVD